MADERETTVNVNEQAPVQTTMTSTDRGLFDFIKKKEDDEKTHDQHEQKFVSEFDDKVKVSECDQGKKNDDEKKHESLLQKLHRSDSSSSSSSDEEGDDEEKKKRKKEKKEKKGLGEKVKEKLPGHKDEDDSNVPIEYKSEEKSSHVHEVVYSEPSHPQDDQQKKGFLDKIKEKLPGKKPDEHHGEAALAAIAPVAATEVSPEGEKKGFLEKIKDKIPGFHSKSGESDQEKKESS